MSPLETDFVSIANNSDVDFFSFTVAAPTLLDVTLTPLGGVFSQGAEGGEQSIFDAGARNDLSLAVFASNSTTVLGSVNAVGAGGIEILSDFELSGAGTYFARVTGSSQNMQLYELQLSAALPVIALPGDYNGNGVVDAADYTVWRDSLGQTGSGLAADGNGNGSIDAGDYSVWKNNFGATSGSGSIVTGDIVPEAPFGAFLCVAAIGWMMHAPRRMRRRG